MFFVFFCFYCCCHLVCSSDMYFWSLRHLQLLVKCFVHITCLHVCIRVGLFWSFPRMLNWVSSIYVTVSLFDSFITFVISFVLLVTLILQRMFFLCAKSTMDNLKWFFKDSLSCRIGHVFFVLLSFYCCFCHLACSGDMFFWSLRHLLSLVKSVVHTMCLYVCIRVSLFCSLSRTFNWISSIYLTVSLFVSFITFVI